MCITISEILARDSAWQVVVQNNLFKGLDRMQVAVGVTFSIFSFNISFKSNLPAGIRGQMRGP